MTPRPHLSQSEKLLYGYNRMMERVKDLLEQTGHKTVPMLKTSIDKAKETAVELGELTRDEAELIGAYLRRDLEDAGEYLAETGNEFKDWFHFDMELIEDRLLEMFTAAADQTKLALLQWAQHAQRVSEYRSGEITTVGSLQCLNCGELLHFHSTGHIPPCPKCHESRFVRKGRQVGDEGHGM